MAGYVLELRGKIYERFKSEAEFARAIGWSRQKLNKITTGKRLPDVTELNQIANGLDVDAGILVHVFLK